ncbi:MAG TPA: hypothetical protein VLJ11_07680 [Bryobacteraceae bacterium]|nr:hypothetical protein [Bryobacteraceae bacterium]
MSLQVFLQAQLLGAENFLAAHSSIPLDGTKDLAGRCAWLSLICEVLPRALLAELKLSRMLLGSSSAEQFLLVLPEEEIPQANEFLNRTAKEISDLSDDALRLVWASTENLGAWPIARKRLDDALVAKIDAPLSASSGPEAFFSPLENAPEPKAGHYFETFADRMPSASAVGWSPESPAQLLWDEGQYRWTLKDQSGVDDETILFPRRFAMNDAGSHLASLGELSARAEGACRWGILRGDIDHFNVRLRQANSIEEHIHLSVLFKEFFAGELSLLCALPEFWRKVTVLYRGGDDFAVLGTWDALILLARELHRLFEKFVEHNLQLASGVEGKTLTMALAIAPDIDAPASAVLEEAGTLLRGAKAVEAGGFHLFGWTLEWKRLADAETLKTDLVRLVRDFGYGPDYIHDLSSIYRETFSSRATRRNKPVRVDKPWRTYMRLMRVLPEARNRETKNLINTVTTSLVGRSTTAYKLRPSSRVGLDWARLAAGH